ncbi:MAG TPA: hypothetical protein VFA20_16675 [Myxococcaceae bacterium]|nr:hypothetical protein [Myxococcaceae bacterium]
MIARSLMVAVAFAVTAVSSGCIVPRSAGYGFTAMPLGPGGADVGVAMGLIYQQESSTTSPIGGATNTSTSRQTQLPAFEANAQLGITDQLSVNLHASQVGLQPGAKITILRDPVVVSVVPQIGGGFISKGASTSTTIGGVTTNTDGDTGTSFTFLGGLHAVVSLPIGLYGGLGYDFQYISQSSKQAATGNTTTAYQQAHNVGGAIGYEIRIGSLALRPELAVLFTPLAKNQSNNGTTTADQPDSGGLFLFPNISVAAVASPQGK